MISKHCMSWNIYTTTKLGTYAYTTNSTIQVHKKFKTQANIRIQNIQNKHYQVQNKNNMFSPPLTTSKRDSLKQENMPQQVKVF